MFDSSDFNKSVEMLKYQLKFESEVDEQVFVTDMQSLFELYRVNEANENCTSEDLKIRVAIEELIPVDMWIWNHLKTVISCRYMYHQNPGMSAEDYSMPDLSDIKRTCINTQSVKKCGSDMVSLNGDSDFVRKQEEMLLNGEK